MNENKSLYQILKGDLSIFKFKKYVKKNYICKKKIYTNDVFNDNCVEIGTINNHCVALKRGANIKREVEIMKTIGRNEYIVEFIMRIKGGILMEGIENGHTLDDFSRIDKQLKVEECLNLIRQLAVALKHIHDRGIIHHDFKNKNILINDVIKPTFIKLCDFNVAEIADDNGFGREENRRLGTYDTMAPEQKYGRSDPITSKIDIYAFSKTCYTIIFCGRKANQVVNDFPIALIELIKKCGSENPEDRPNIDKVITSINLCMSGIVNNNITKIIELCKKLRANNVAIPEEIMTFCQTYCVEN